MRTHWKKGLAQISIWLLSEIILNLVGLDTLADYNEYILSYKQMFVSTATWYDGNQRLDGSHKSFKGNSESFREILWYI